MLKYILTLLICLNLYAGELDLGLGYIGLQANHYKGSNETKLYNLYVPYIDYQGEYVEANNAIVNTNFVNNRYITLKLSLSAAPNVSNDNKARANMPELNYNFGTGPMLVLHLLKSRTFELNIAGNYREELETDLDYTANIGNTQSNYISMNIFQDSWSLELSHGVINANKSFHDYYYSVAPEFETSTRSAYKSKAGFSSRITIVTLRKEIGDFMLFPFYRHESLKGSIIEASPLVKQTDYHFFGMGLFYLFI